MTLRINIPDKGLSFSAAEDETVLMAARRNGIQLPHSCLGGSCGSCVGVITEGEIRYPKGKPLALTDDDIHQGKAAFCQAIPKTNLSIQIHQVRTQTEAPHARMMPCRIASLNKVTTDVAIMTLSLPPQTPFDFWPGQYIEILLKDGSRRAFSIANTGKEADNEVTLHIRRVPDGRFTTAVFETLKPGALLRIEGPMGDFYWRDDLNHPVICVAGGTGIGPILSMLYHLPDKHQNRNIELYWGARNVKDLYVENDISQLMHRLPQLSYTPVLSSTEPGSWRGATGFVHATVASQHPDVSDTAIYLCGPPPMVHAVIDTLTPQGLSTELLYYDSFEFSGT